MSGAFLSLLGRWWARLRAAPKAEPRAGPPVRPSETPCAPTPAEITAAPPNEDVEACFLEMVGGGQVTAPAVAVSMPSETPEVVRVRTLAAMAELRQLPALQALVQGFLKAMSRPNVTVDEVVEAIENDAALCVRVLGQANSVAVGSAERIEDLQTAVQMIGVVRVRRTSQAVFTLRSAQRMTDGLDWRHLWIHAFATAAIAEELERRLRPVGDSQVHLAALLHDVGKIVLSTVAGEAYRQILVAAWNGGGRLEELERERLGVDHREAGAVFAKRNQLPQVVVAAITHHATPEEAEEYRWEVALVALANHLSKAYGLGFSGSRLEEDEGEFAELAAWKIVGAELGYAPDPEEVQESLADFIASLRVELRELRDTGVRAA